MGRLFPTLPLNAHADKGLAKTVIDMINCIVSSIEEGNMPFIHVFPPRLGYNVWKE